MAPEDRKRIVMASLEQALQIESQVRSAFASSGGLSVGRVHFEGPLNVE